VPQPFDVRRTSMNLMDLYPARYLKAADIPPEGLRGLTIVDIQQEKMRS
jgi:hypothetical protein